MLRCTSWPITRCVSIWFLICCLKSSKVMPVCSRMQSWNLSGSAILLLHLDFGDALGHLGIRR